MFLRNGTGSSFHVRIPRCATTAAKFTCERMAIKYPRHVYERELLHSTHSIPRTCNYIYRGVDLTQHPLSPLFCVNINTKTHGDRDVDDANAYRGDISGRD